MKACSCCLWQRSNLGDCILPSSRFSCGAKTTYSSCIFPNKTKRTPSGTSVCRGHVWERGTKPKKPEEAWAWMPSAPILRGRKTSVTWPVRFCLYVGSFILYSKSSQAYTECCRWRCFPKGHKYSWEIIGQPLGKPNRMETGLAGVLIRGNPVSKTGLSLP